MKKYIFIIIGILIIGYSCFNINITFGSDATLYYDGNSKEFIYYNLDSSDLFNEFKDLMPGDTKLQSLSIKTHNVKSNTKLYLKLNSDINKEILDYIKISYYVNGNMVKANDDMILISDFDVDTTIELKIKISVPIEIGNAINELSYKLKWSFLIEENGELVEVPDTRKNDYSSIYLIVLIIIGSGSIIYGILQINKKKKI